MSNTSRIFEPLVTIFRGDSARICQALRAFELVTRSDLERMKRGCADRDLSMLASFAHKTKSACRQLGEYAAVDALEAVELALAENQRLGRPIDAAAALAFAEVGKVLDRVEEYLAASDE